MPVPDLKILELEEEEMVQIQEKKSHSGFQAGRLLTVEEVATQIGVCKRTIYEWTAEGRLPHFKVGRVLRFRQADIDAFIQEQIDQSHPDEPLDSDDLQILDWADTVA